MEDVFFPSQSRIQQIVRFGEPNEKSYLAFLNDICNDTRVAK